MSSTLTVSQTNTSAVMTVTITSQSQSQAQALAWNRINYSAQYFFLSNAPLHLYGFTRCQCQCHAGGSTEQVMVMLSILMIQYCNYVHLLSSKQYIYEYVYP